MIASQNDAYPGLPRKCDNSSDPARTTPGLAVPQRLVPNMIRIMFDRFAVP
ncbi:hypothetical protein [Mycolicibacterium sp. HK-90]|uniref:hypothetical protein n=1 Tax=Mycolicibacterium sp. HK-90 TaxID=3056937 RepID=UPI002658BEAA|nr:hypothetical protein [Mycolicibacterium sp. HK-90]WKG01689.1 hypothetical protein QU592_20825 [Mycolicibacterium sp. HK-90]